MVCADMAPDRTGPATSYLRSRTATELRRRARRVRQHAKMLAGDEAEERLLQFAKELESRAARLEIALVTDQ